ncbi:MAG: NAD-dependent epimerase/dehydratase family protein [Gemmatimonadaceae bacterium]
MSGTPRPRDGSAAQGAPVVVITGATGFVGRHLSAQFKAKGWTIRGIIRPATDPRRLPPGVVPVLSEHTDTSRIRDGVRGADAVVHLAARVHRPGETTPRWREQYRLDNVRPTETLVSAAVAEGVRRFVFVSTVRVHGTSRMTVCRAEDEPAPPDAYAESKLEAEAVVRGAARELDWVIVRPAFVYGRDGRGNFDRLVRLTRLACRVPLPLDGLRGLRSMMYVENLASLLLTCVEHPAAARHVLLAADDPPVASNRLIRLVGDALDCRPRLYSCPSAILRTMAALVRRSEDLSRLADDYVVDTTPLASVLGWRSPVSIEEALRRSVTVERG